MQLFQQTLSLNFAPAACISAVPEEILFFDIETTGLSATSSYIYLIGCIDCIGGMVTLRQWFLDDISEEKLLIQSFLAHASGFKKLVHYNGTTFDVPFLQKKCQRHRLRCTIEPLESIDLYRQLTLLRRLFQLPDLKQKTVEHFLGLSREDIFSGSDLIPVYTEYLAKARLEALRASSAMSPATSDFSQTGLPAITDSPANALLTVLLLHNHEDLIGLYQIAGLLPLLRFCDGDFKAQAAAPKIPDTLTLTLLAGQSLLPLATAEAYSTKPLQTKPLPCTDNPRAELSLRLLPDASGMQLQLPFYHATLKYFFENYKEYYYLPAEDQAIHRSVAEFVEPAYRTKATRENCYQKRTGAFLFQPLPGQTPAFREHAKDKGSFFSPDEAFFSSPEKLQHYALQLLKWILTK